MGRLRSVPRDSAMLERKPGQNGGTAMPRPGQKMPSAGKGIQSAMENESAHPLPVADTPSFPDPI